MFQIIAPNKNEPFTIGRREGNSLRFGDVFVSREHAVISFKNGNWFLKNLTQNSYTFLNEKNVDESVLKDSDSITIGTHKIRVSLEKEELSLLILDDEDDVQKIPLTENFSTIVLDENLKISARIVLDQAEVLYRKKITLKNKELCRIQNKEIKLQDKNLLIRSIAVGFDISVKNLDVFAGKKKLLENLNFELKAGEILAVIGRSGQGKSTLLKLLEGALSKGQNSEVYIGGLPYSNNDIRKRMAIQAQDPAVRADLTVKESILHGARTSMDKKDFKKNAEIHFEKFAELFGLQERVQNRIATLSGGELRRMALAEELMGNPGLILLDEPLSGLDPYNAQILCKHLKQLSFLGHTIILTTHSYEALNIAHKVLIIHQGKQGFFGAPEECYQFFKSRNPEEILSRLNDETHVEWKRSQLDEEHKRKKYAHVEFPKIRTKNFFWYQMAITLKQWTRDKGKLLALFLQPLIIGFLFSQIFSKQSSLWTVSFALILCANWFALSLSIRELVQEKELFKRDFRKGVNVLAVFSGKLFIPMIAAFLQTFIVFIFINFKLELSISIPLLSLVFASTIFPAVATGLLTSALSKNTGQANAFLPLLIIPQIALAGALVPLDQMQKIGRLLSAFIWSRYNQTSLLDLFLNNLKNYDNTSKAFLLGLCFCIITYIILQLSKKVK